MQRHSGQVDHPQRQKHQKHQDINAKFNQRFFQSITSSSQEQEKKPTVTYNDCKHEITLNYEIFVGNYKKWASLIFDLMLIIMNLRKGGCSVHAKTVSRPCSIKYYQIKTILPGAP
jgi:hypothetical protein